MKPLRYPIIKNNWVLKLFSDILENEIEYDVLLSSELLGEKGWCAVAIDVKKEYEDFIGGIIFDGSITSSFKLKYRKEDLTAKILYDLMKIAGSNFSIAFTELVKGSTLEGTKISVPVFEDYERYLNQIIKNSN